MQDWGHESSYNRVKSFRGASVAAADSTGGYGLIIGDHRTLGVSDLFKILIHLLWCRRVP